MIQFGIGIETDSIDHKVILKVDTDSDVNSLNLQIFQKLFPRVELQLSLTSVMWISGVF